MMEVCQIFLVGKYIINAICALRCNLSPSMLSDSSFPNLVFLNPLLTFTKTILGACDYRDMARFGVLY